MFTGLVQCVGEVADIRRQGREQRLTIRPRCAMPNLRDGESISVNGACLSVENHDGALFTAYASEETLSKTNLVRLGHKSLVNLERALEMGQRLDGHLVTGHVDCLAILEKKEKSGQSLRLRLSFPVEFGPEVVEKGSVALDGISLTVNKCGDDFLEVNIIPDSRKRTNIHLWQIGDGINMETDLIGKYVFSAMRARAAPGGIRSSITAEYLSKYGFL